MTSIDENSTQKIDGFAWKEDPGHVDAKSDHMKLKALCEGLGHFLNHTFGTEKRGMIGDCLPKARDLLYNDFMIAGSQNTAQKTALLPVSSHSPHSTVDHPFP